jgi:single-stranded DNA-binding protein
MQIVQLIGHIGRDAETKHIGERDYLSFSVACTDKRNNEEQTSWYSILYPLQESIAPYLKKGQQVYVMGRLSAKIFQSNNSFGIDLSVFAQTLQLCGGKKEEATAPAASPALPAV